MWRGGRCHDQCWDAVPLSLSSSQEFEDALTVKNFIFQFFNNYFVLFYIV